jgi:hypothetical protein
VVCGSMQKPPVPELCVSRQKLMQNTARSMKGCRALPPLLGWAAYIEDCILSIISANAPVMSIHSLTKKLALSETSPHWLSKTKQGGGGKQDG